MDRAPAAPLVEIALSALVEAATAVAGLELVGLREDEHRARA